MRRLQGQLAAHGIRANLARTPNHRLNEGRLATSIESGENSPQEMAHPHKILGSRSDGHGAVGEIAGQSWIERQPVIGAKAKIVSRACEIAMQGRRLDSMGLEKSDPLI